jgi:hypothetical protein
VRILAIAKLRPLLADDEARIGISLCLIGERKPACDHRIISRRAGKCLGGEHPAEIQIGAALFVELLNQRGIVGRVGGDRHMRVILGRRTDH